MQTNSLSKRFKILGIKHKKRIFLLILYLSFYRFLIKKGRAKYLLGKSAKINSNSLSKKDKTLVLWYQKTLPKLTKKLPFHCSCLNQALAVRKLLSQKNITINLCLGVKDIESLKAHAWLEIDNILICCGAQPSRFKTFDKSFQLH